MPALPELQPGSALWQVVGDVELTRLCADQGISSHASHIILATSPKKGCASGCLAGQPSVPALDWWPPVQAVPSDPQ
jgi:hypothetical protein